jgi:hypothetical protein
MPEPAAAFESWLLRRVAQSVEAGEVPADLLTELQGQIEAAKGGSQEEGHAKAVRDLADRLGIPVMQAEQALVGLEAQPPVTRELLMRRIAEAWPVQQQTARRGQEKIPTGEKGARPWKPTSC